MTKPYSVRIYLPGGDPDGLRTIEKSNWSRAGIVIPGSLMAEAKSRRELARTGVYPRLRLQLAFHGGRSGAGLISQWPHRLENQGRQDA